MYLDESLARGKPPRDSRARRSGPVRVCTFLLRALLLLLLLLGERDRCDRVHAPESSLSFSVSFSFSCSCSFSFSPHPGAARGSLAFGRRSSGVRPGTSATPLPRPPPKRESHLHGSHTYSEHLHVRPRERALRTDEPHGDHYLTGRTGRACRRRATTRVNAYARMHTHIHAHIHPSVAFIYGHLRQSVSPVVVCVPRT